MVVALLLLLLLLPLLILLRERPASVVFFLEKKHGQAEPIGLRLCETSGARLIGPSQDIRNMHETGNV